MKKILVLFAAVFIASCTVDSKKAIKKDNNLSEKIAYSEEVNMKVINDDENYKMILFAIKSDQFLEPHSAPMDTPLLILEGSTKVTIGKEEQVLNEGDLITLPKDIDHGVYPITNVKFLLIK